MCFTVNFAKLLRTPVFTEHLWAPASVIRTVQCGTLTIKKTSAKTLQIGLYSVFLNLPIKHVQENKRVKKKNGCKRKRTFPYTNFSSIAILKSKDVIFYVNFVS